MGEEKKVDPEVWMRETGEKIDKLCKGIECLPDLVKKVEGIKIPEASVSASTPTPQKHNVFSWMSYCPECGEKLRESPPEYQCSNCGVPVDPKKDKVCWNCGSKKAKERKIE